MKTPRRRPQSLHRLVGLLLAAVAVPGAAHAAGLRLLIHEGRPMVSQAAQPVISGVTNAAAGAEVLVTIGELSASAPVGPDGAWSLVWPQELAGGVYTVLAQVTHGGETGRARQSLIVQPRGRLPRRPLVPVPLVYAPPPEVALEDFEAFTDRWRIVPPPYELNVQGSRWDPYNQNVLKGDYPILGQDIFLNLTAVSDSLVEGRSVPTPSGVSTDEPGSISFFGDDGQGFFNQNVVVSADLFKGDTAFKPFDWRVKATVVGNVNHVAVGENAVVRPDVREGTTRTDGRGSLQELFFEYKLADLSPHYDFVSVRAGIQPFSSDFRGFVFTDTNLGIRLFGNWSSNRYQYNLAYFERLEKDTNSGLNTFEMRDQQVVVANLYRQDFLVKGYTTQVSLHYLRDEPTFVFDRNGFLARPDPIGEFTPHEIKATYLGWAGFGHLGRWNVDHALYWVFGDDSLNPIAGRQLDLDTLEFQEKVDIEASMAALELSWDRDWLRPKLALFHASGDSAPSDRTARGFDAIFDNPAFVGGGFSFWNRLGIRLAGTGVALVNRGSLLPDLKSSKEEGQPNFVNPGLQLLSLGLDVEVTPKIKGVATANYLRFDDTATLELVLFQDTVRRDIGWDLSAGVRYRPLLNNNIILVAGVAALLPGRGFEDIYEDDSTLLAGFTTLTLTF